MTPTLTQTATPTAPDTATDTPPPTLTFTPIESDAGGKVWRARNGAWAEGKWVTDGGVRTGWVPLRGVALYAIILPNAMTRTRTPVR